MSIQLTLDGLYFCVAQEKTPLCIEEVSFTVDTPLFDSVQTAFDTCPLLKFTYLKCRVILDLPSACLLPESLYDSTCRETYLKANGIVKADSEVSIACRPIDGVVALIAIPSSVYALLNERLIEVDYLHPLQLNMMKKWLRPTLEFNLSKSHLHLTLRNEALLYAQVLPYREDAELLEYLHHLQAQYDLKGVDLSVGGYGAAAVAKFLSRYHKPVREESKTVAALPAALRKVGRDTYCCANLIQSLSCV